MPPLVVNDSQCGTPTFVAACSCSPDGSDSSFIASSKKSSCASPYSVDKNSRNLTCLHWWTNLRRMCFRRVNLEDYPFTINESELFDSVPKHTSWRRVTYLVEDRNTGLTRDNLLVHPPHTSQSVLSLYAVSREKSKNRVHESRHIAQQPHQKRTSTCHAKFTFFWD